MALRELGRALHSGVQVLVSAVTRPGYLSVRYGAGPLKVPVGRIGLWFP